MAETAVRVTWAGWRKFSKGKHNILHLGWDNPMQHYRLGVTVRKAAEQKRA